MVIMRKEIEYIGAEFSCSQQTNKLLLFTGINHKIDFGTSPSIHLDFQEHTARFHFFLHQNGMGTGL
jgi:hypothetical protein